MNSRFVISIFTFVAISAVLRMNAADPFAENIRTTDPLTPALEQKTFHLPPGFEIQLVAGEPDINKPMNMAFDAQGRLWVTTSREYPYPAPLDKPARDRIMIFEDFGPDGRARKVTQFAAGLNIPIGFYPYQNGVIAWSIPNIWRFQDTDGDGKADQRDVFYGPFDHTRDTHGNQASFRRGFDGWLYATHGYNNDTHVKGRDGHEVHMNSGNAYRLRLDGSRIENYSWGQVNPFGLMFDPLGDLWSADCHSSPVYQLLRGAYYPSFGKPHDGLGFGPEVCTHSHGSTAISGMVFYAATNFPPEFRGNTFIGNVMTCRINRDSLVEHGSTRIAKEEPDFLSTDDPWFRPVDLQLGPDGAMYVADFYNRIIGHYEVPLAHPGRDRERGRIWRIVYRGEVGQTSSLPILKRFDLSRARVPALIAELGNANLTCRMLAMNQLIDRIGKSALEPVKQMMRAKGATAFQKMHGLWVLRQLDGLEEKILAAAFGDADRGVRTHAMRVLADLPRWTAAQQQSALIGLRDADAYVRRAAADAIGLHPDFANFRPLLDLRHHVQAEDAQLLHTVRMALRDQLKPPGNFSRLPLPGWTEADARAIADVALGVPSAEAGAYLLQHLQRVEEPRETLVNGFRHIARYAEEKDMDSLANFSRAKFSNDIDFQLLLFKSVQEGTAQRGGQITEDARAWASNIAEKLFASFETPASSWFNTPVEGMANTTNPWFLQRRASADEDKSSLFLCSLPPDGEELTGVLRSKPFAVPAKLSFFLAGHDGYPHKPAQKKNLVRLLAADTRQVIAETLPPRNDVAQRVTWDLSAHTGQQAFLEVTDGDNGDAYAWLAIGRFDPPVIALPAISPSQIGQPGEAAADLARTLRLKNLEPPLARLFTSAATEINLRAAAARALIVINPTAHLASFSAILNNPNEAVSLREKIAQGLMELNAPATETMLAEAIKAAPQRLQVKLAVALAGTPSGGETLLATVTEGKASPRLLQERAVRERLNAAKVSNWRERAARLTKGLTPANETLQKLIDQRRAAFNPAKASAVQGAIIFTQTCAVCHQIDGQGALIGPQLDGIGNRGLERLIEDVLDPNRNVDVAFRYSTITLKDDEVISGLQRREEGEVLIFADSTGKEIAVPKKQIKERTESELSLMPDNVSEIIPPEDFNHLMAFLLSKATKQSK